jgi:hypothetical protein
MFVVAIFSAPGAQRCLCNSRTSRQLLQASSVPYPHKMVFISVCMHCAQAKLLPSCRPMQTGCVSGGSQISAHMAYGCIAQESTGVFMRVLNALPVKLSNELLTRSTPINICLGVQCGRHWPNPCFKCLQCLTLRKGRGLWIAPLSSTCFK